MILRKSVVFLMAIISIISVGEPVLAWETYHQGPRGIDWMLCLEPDANASYTMTINLSDPASGHLLNYNQSVLPFINDTGIDGVFTGPWMPPSLIMIHNGSVMDSKIMGITRFKSVQVMSGSSYSWWRVPLENPFSAGVVLRIWSIENPELLNWTGGSINPTEISHPILIWNYTYNFKSNMGLNKTFYWWNMTSDWNYSHHWVWAQVIAPLKADTAYAYQWEFVDAPTAIRVYFSLNDIGDDYITRAWTYAFGHAVCETAADIDCSVIHQYGIGDSVSGFHISAGSSITFYSRLSEPIQNGDNLTFLMPFIKDISNTTNAHVLIREWNYTMGGWTEDYWIAFDGQTDFTIKSFTWDKAYGAELFFINVTFQNQSNSIFVHDPITTYNPNFIDDSTYSIHKFRIYGNANYTDGFYAFFRPYHALQITEGAWVNTEIPPIYILDGHVINITVLEKFDASEYYPMEYWIQNGLETIRLTIYNGVMNWDFPVLHRLFPGLGNFTLRDIVDKVGRIIGAIVGPDGIMYHIGAWLAKSLHWWADNGSYVFAALFHGLSLFIFVPIFLVLLFMVNGIKRFFVIFARDGPEPAVEYADRFMQNSIQMIYRTPVARAGKAIAGRMQ